MFSDEVDIGSIDSVGVFTEKNRKFSNKNIDGSVEGRIGLIE